ncbi:DUF7848 domain-containing protein [Streptomyces nodosus]
MTRRTRRARQVGRTRPSPIPTGPRLQHLDGSAWAFDVRCITGDCSAASGPMESASGTDGWAVRHGATTGHGAFQRTVTDLASLTLHK